MEKIPVTNSTQMPIYVGATMIPAGETRHFDLADVPHHLRPAAVEAESAPEASDPVADLQKKPLKEIRAALNSLSGSDLQRLSELESAAKSPRKSLLEEIAAIQLAGAGGNQ
ncbi:MAG: hypothetical protein Q8L65_17245 [Burkholderiales bacterium]|nr:hypothetical protein [Burkholderiales bacterium]MDP2398867.1 hypothetical protein [Burkholderiales bacterium]